MKFGRASRPVHGSNYNGDMYLIKEFNNKVIISVIDGLGHGESAAVASSKCMKCIQDHYDQELAEIFKYCDIELRKTNGVVMGILFIDFYHSNLSFAGVGNISARVIGSNPVHFISRDGIVGYNMPRIKENKHIYTAGDTILMHSDGISSRVVRDPASILLKKDVQEAADEIMELFGKEEDDATVIVAR